MYVEIKKVLSIITRDAPISTEELLRFRSATVQADFLFGREIPTYIDEVYKTGLRLWKANAELEEASLSKEERQRIVSEKYGALRRLSDQLPLLSGKFKKHLDLSD